MEEWISLRQYMKRFKLGYEVVLQMINNREVEYRKTPGDNTKSRLAEILFPRSCMRKNEKGELKQKQH